MTGPKGNSEFCFHSTSTFTRIRINFFFPNSKLYPSTSNIFKSNSLAHTHPMVSGFTLEKLGLDHIGLLLGKRLDTILLRHRRIHRLHVIGFVAEFFFPLWRADLKMSGFAVEFAGSSYPERKRYSDRCGRVLWVSGKQNSFFPLGPSLLLPLITFLSRNSCTESDRDCVRMVSDLQI